MSCKLRRSKRRARRRDEQHEIAVNQAQLTLKRLKAQDPLNFFECAGVAVKGGHKGQTNEVLLWT